MHGKAGVKRTKGTCVTLDGLLAMWERREHRLIKENNGACTLRGILIAVVPWLLVLIVFLSSRKLRESKLSHMYLEILITVFFVVAFQVSFFLMGLRWSYPTGDEMMTFVTRQYVKEATEDNGGQPPRRDERVSRLVQ